MKKVSILFIIFIWAFTAAFFYGAGRTEWYTVTTKQKLFSSGFASGVEVAQKSWFEYIEALRNVSSQKCSIPGYTGGASDAY